MSRSGELYSGQLAIDRGNEQVICDYNATFIKLDNGMYKDVISGEIYSTTSSDEDFYILNIKKVSKSTLFLIALKKSLFEGGCKVVFEPQNEQGFDSFGNLIDVPEVYTNRQKTRVM